MIMTFAKCQVVVADTGATSDCFTDPISLGENDRGAAILLIHYIYGGGTLTYTAQVSNDGVEWVDTLLTEGATAAAATPLQEVQDLNGAFLRFKFSLANGGGGQGGVSFDLHVDLDKK